MNADLAYWFALPPWTVLPVATLLGDRLPVAGLVSTSFDTRCDDASQSVVTS